MKFTMEEIEKLSGDLTSGLTDEIPSTIELDEIRDFLKFFVGIGVYVVSISKSLESINGRLRNIECALVDEKEIGKA